MPRRTGCSGDVGRLRLSSTWMLDVLRVLGGGLFLYLGAEWLVRGAAGLARALGVRPLIIGLTVIAYGTFAPELVVSMVAALDGKPAIALGNVIGSNIANLGLILGATALLAPPRVDATLIRREVPLLLFSALAIPVLLFDGVVSRIEGALLVATALGFTYLAVRSARGTAPADAALRAEVREEVAEEAPTGSKAKLLGLSVLGLGGLVAGGKVFVDGAVGIALTLGMSERMVGLTIVAVGTSLPELAASLVAARRGHAALAVGNVVGSNIFNVLLILGATALARPIEGSLSVLRNDLIALAVVTVMGAVFLRGDRVLSRIEGSVLVAGYAAFLVFLAVVS